MTTTSGCWMVVVDVEVETVFTDEVPLSVIHDSRALQLTAPNASENKGKAAATVAFILDVRSSG